MAVYMVTSILPFTHLPLFSHSYYSYAFTSVLYLLLNFFWQGLSSLFNYDFYSFGYSTFFLNSIIENSIYH